jgi:hypothetical protein
LDCRNVERTAAMTLTWRSAVGCAIATGSLLLVLVTSPSGAQVNSPSAISLGTASTYAILSPSVFTAGADDTVNGNIGTTTWAGPSVNQRSGAEYINEPSVTNQPFADASSALTEAQSDSTTTTTVADISGETFTPGVYASGASTMAFSTNITLNGEGDPNAVFIFNVGTTLATAAATKVILENGANACNVIWNIGTTFAAGAGSNFSGIVLSDGALTLGADVNMTGSLIDTSAGAITLGAGDDISTCTPALPPTTTTTLGSVATTTTSLSPSSVPSAPLNPTQRNGVGASVVSWSAPISPGVPSVTGYTVQYSTTAGSVFQDSPGCINVDVLTCTVAGLNDTSVYVFRVFALNAAGSGPASVVTVNSTPTLAAPSVSALNTKVLASWTRPAFPTGTLLSYFVTSTPGNFTCSSASTSCTVSGLTNGVSYSFVVEAIDAAGESTFSPSSHSVTPSSAKVTAPFKDVLVIKYPVNGFSLSQLQKEQLVRLARLVLAHRDNIATITGDVSSVGSVAINRTLTSLRSVVLANFFRTELSALHAVGVSIRSTLTNVSGVSMPRQVKITIS